MASKFSPISSSMKIKQAMSKKAEKMSLVAKRLSMLQDDAPNNGSSTLVFKETPLVFKSKSTNGKSDKSKIISVVSEQKVTRSPNPVKELDEDSHCDLNDIPLPSGRSANRMKYGSHKRAMVLSDDESQEDGTTECLIPPSKKGRKTKQKGDTCNDSFNDENINGACDNSRNLKIKTKQKGDTCNDSFNDENINGACDNSRNLKMNSDIVGLPNDLSEDKLSTSMERARKVQANLSAQYPSFIKLMKPSHVSGGFWLGILAKFCKANLPEEDCVVVLVDEAGMEFKTNYLAYKTGLSGGWRGFSIHHDLQMGDALVFHLIHPTTFKVYIVREHRIDGVDGALALPELDTCEGQTLSGNDFQRVHHTENNPPIDSIPLSPGNSEADIKLEVFDGICFSESDINFEAVTDFENFNIIVYNLVIDSKFSNANRKKYYDLCCSQNTFLHQQLLKGLNCNTVVGIILETINIADAIKACSSLTSIEDLQTWKTTLSAFEHLGMKVDFMCAKLDQLLGIALDLDGAIKCTVKRGCASERMRNLENKLTKLKKVMEKISLEIEDERTASAQKHKAMIKKLAITPW